MIDEYYADFTICVGTNILECEDCYLGMHFVDVHHDMFNWPDGNNYIGASWSFIYDFYLHIVSLKLTLNKKTPDSEYNAEILEYSLKADYHFDLPNNTRTVVRYTTNDANKLADYFSEGAEQVNCEMHQLNSAMKYGSGMLENTRSTIAVDYNGLRIKLSN